MKCTASSAAVLTFALAAAACSTSSSGDGDLASDAGGSSGTARSGSAEAGATSGVSSSSGGSSSGISPGGTSSPGWGDAGADGAAHGDAGSTKSTDAGGTSSSSLSAGCGKPAAASGVLHPAPLMINGRSRTWELTVPSTYEPQTGHVYTTVFHGLTGTGDAVRTDFDLEAQSGNAGIFAYPDGNSSGPAWHVEEDGEDMAFYDAMLAYVEANYCVDTRKIFLAGFSAGTYAANFFSCYRSDIVRGVASISGGFYNGFTGAYGPPATCAKPYSAYVAHGTSDTTVGLSWGEDTRTFYEKLDGCSSSSSPPSLDPTNCVSYDGCQDGTSVLWCTHPGGHEIVDFERADVWKFFSSFE